MLLLSTQFWPQTANVQRLQCESVRAVPSWCDGTEAAVAFLRDALRLRLQMLCDGAITCCHTFVRRLLVQLVWDVLLVSRVCSGTAFPSCVVSRIFPPDAGSTQGGPRCGSATARGTSVVGGGERRDSFNIGS